MAENLGSAKYNTFISSDSPCFKKAEFQRHWKGLQQGWVQFKRKVFLKTIWEQKWMVLGKKVRLFVVDLCVSHSQPTLHFRATFIFSTNQMISWPPLHKLPPPNALSKALLARGRTCTGSPSSSRKAKELTSASAPGRSRSSGSQASASSKRRPLL
jgi:hypothetical protein